MSCDAQQTVTVLLQVAALQCDSFLWLYFVELLLVEKCMLLFDVHVFQQYFAQECIFRHDYNYRTSVI